MPDKANNDSKGIVRGDLLIRRVTSFLLPESTDRFPAVHLAFLPLERYILCVSGSEKKKHLRVLLFFTEGGFEGER